MTVTKVKKIYLDDIWLNPKYFIIENQQGKDEESCPQRLSLVRGVDTSVSKCLRLSHKKYDMDKI